MSAHAATVAPPTPCRHERVTGWRWGLYDTPGPRFTRTVAGETLERSWTTCLDCGTRLERARVTSPATVRTPP